MAQPATPAPRARAARRALRAPNKGRAVTVLGFALFVATNETIVAGGVFPFLPLEMQATGAMTLFHAVLTLAFTLCLGAGAAASYRRPRLASLFPIRTASAVYVLGWAALTAWVYLPQRANVLCPLAAALIGVGIALFSLMWECVFAAQRPEPSNRAMLMGTALAPVMYLGFNLLPIAIAAALVPLVFMPLFALALTLSAREVGNGRANPAFRGEPTERPRAYRRLLKDYWGVAFSVGMLAFACGAVRALALATPQVGVTVNNLSMLALCVAACALLALWQRKPLRLNVALAFYALFPFITTAFALLPVAPAGYLGVLACALYAIYNCSISLVMIQCAQASRDRVMNPLFVYGFVAGVVYALHGLGFLGGSAVEALAGAGAGAADLPLETFALLGTYGLGIVFFVAQGGFSAAFSPGRLSAGNIEFVTTSASGLRHRPSSPAPASAGGAGAGAGSAGAGAGGSREGANARSARAGAVPMPAGGTRDARAAGAAARPDGTAAGAGGRGARPGGGGTRLAGGGTAFLDRTSKQCLMLQRQYKLSDRETQIVDCIARGSTVAVIAKTFSISENTVRTHTKRLYSKLGIHKKQELLELVARYDPSTLVDS
ncbi:MAG: helix-turn-helix transcriptional regulator [Coriobacteriales bacterium]|jgi:DNA-binding CsgD family transcriptional regulator